MADPKEIMEIDDIEDIVKELNAPVISKNDLKHYYEYLFPYKQFFQWLGNAQSDYFERREFSFTLDNDIYCRFLCFKSDEDFKKAVLNGVPNKIDIGAVYSTLVFLH